MPTEAATPHTSGNSQGLHGNCGQTGCWASSQTLHSWQCPMHRPRIALRAELFAGAAHRMLAGAAPPRPLTSCEPHWSRPSHVLHV